MSRSSPVACGFGTDPSGFADRPQAVVLGVGNTLLTDEAAGVQVVDVLRQRSDLGSVALIDGGTLSFTLLDSIASAPALVVVDAAELGAAPGTVRSFRGPAMDRFLGTSRHRTVHEVGLLDLLAMARLLDVLPARRALVCIQPAQIGLGLELSPPVQAAMDRAVDVVVDLLARWRCTRTRGPTIAPPIRRRSLPRAGRPK